MKTLCIGGPADGERVWSESQVVFTAIPTKAEFLSYSEGVPFRPISNERATYYREFLRGEDKVFEFLRYDQTTIDEALDLLLKNYKPCSQK